MKTLFVLAFMVFALCGSTRAETKSPNIVVVFVDDMGWGDFSCFGNKEAQTPNVDRLAEEGIRFSQFYVNSPICSPSRCALATGQYPQRWKITSFLSNRADNQRRGVANWLAPHSIKKDTPPVILASGTSEVNVTLQTHRLLAFMALTNPSPTSKAWGLNFFH